MDFRQLQSFVQVAELGSFTRAAQVLGVAQPALSRQVRALEVDLRQTLFARNGRGVTLTEAGTSLLAHGRGILQQVQRARQELTDPGGGTAGALSIGLPPSLSRTLTGPLVEAFTERWPRATLTIVEGLSNYTLEWLAQGRVDCAVVYNALPTAAVDLLPVLSEQLFLVSGRALQGGATRGPASLAELARQPLVIPSRPHAIRMRLEAVLALAGLKPTVALEIESVPALLDLVCRRPLHAVLSRNALRASGHEERFAARAIVLPEGRGHGSAGAAPVAGNKARSRALLGTTLWIATSAQRPLGPLLQQATVLLDSLLKQNLRAQASPL